MGMIQVDNAATAPASLPTNKTNETPSCLTIRTGNIACIARFYPALYQLTLVKDGVEEKVDLGYSGSRLLERLVQNPGEVVSRDELMEHAWSGRVVGQGSLNQQIYTLRQILCDESTRDIIQTLPRRGYLINPTYVEMPVEVAPTAEAEPEPELAASAPVIAPAAPTATPSKASKRRWLIPALVGFSSLSVGAAFNYQQSSESTGKGNLLTITYAPEQPDDLVNLVVYGEKIKHRLKNKLTSPLHVVVGLHEKTVNVMCLHNDGTGRSLHFAENQSEQITTAALAPCLH